MKTDITPFGFDIRKDANGNVSLTDLFKLSGKGESHKPSQWLRSDIGVQLIDTLKDVLKVSLNHLLIVQKGRTGNTFANKQLALAYAKYLDPKLHVAVNQIFFERLAEEKNPELIFQRGIDTYKNKGKDAAWIDERFKGVHSRKQFTRSLARHGVSSQKGFQDCTNAIYTPLYGGNTKLIRAKKDIDNKTSIRDSMSKSELMAVALAEELAKEAIEKHNMNGTDQCKRACLISSKSVAQSIILSRKNNSLFFDNK
jgi:hypothetical protein